MKKELLMLALLVWATHAFSQEQTHIKECFDFDWKFSLSDDVRYAEPKYADAHWEDIQLPHDWNIKQEFDREAGGSAAYLPEGIGWYRKTFKLPSSYKGRCISILFDGIFQQSDVYINGQHLGFRPYGFCSIEYDMTSHLHYDKENVIAVRVNTTGGRPRWYSGAGIYRHAWLQALNPVHVATYGTYITTPEVSNEEADLHIVTTISNKTAKEQTVSVQQKVYDAAGKQVVAKSPNSKIAINAGTTADLAQNFILTSPELWSIGKPTLYRMETTVKTGNKVTDVYNTTFGVRTFRFDKDKGFFLNDKPIKLKGMCLHQDAGSLGTAVPDRSYERRLEILKEYGCNAIRCAHNQPSPEFLDMCDRMGFVVIDEAFDKWKSGYYEKYFDEWWQKDMADMILRDRNHPGIILWSIGNEVQEAWDGSTTGVERARMLQDFVHKLEPTRPATLAAQNRHQDAFAGVTDVIGYNYLEARMLSDRRKYPERIFLISEELPYFRGEEGRIRSYTPLNPWEIVAKNDFVAGGFIWSGVDYLGEAGWPSKGWPNGLFDICMFEKPRAAYHRAMWNPEPMVRIAIVDPSLDIDHGRDLWQWPKMAAHWNFPQSYRGMVMEIRTTTNCESVELYLDDKLMGKQHTANFTNNTIVWYLPYNPGKLEAKGYNGDEEVAHYRLVTSGNTDRAIVSPDRTEIKADGQDLSHIAISLIDAKGNPVQTDDRKVTVRIEGEGKFLGIDNGDLRRQKSFAGNELKTYFGKALAVVQSTRKAGKMTVYVQVEGIDEEYAIEVESI
ncbi:glycoside hydrolase family 2 TIM barrel-domain containing protein [Bacteroides timonensis]|uniref:glycoside hydrolase family 2 TIM barrel-domain containing protein n=1 Tax=Bacteroides timonensis TaxID=1470345 RepID=UPI0004BBA47D|nr:glycoside hydrolase family 2 TIM barrel-domain containing protein [Bacteroides timonensis]